MNSRSHSRGSLLPGSLSTDITPPISIASHLAQSVGPGASAVDLGEGAKRDAPLFLNMSDAEGSKSDHLEIWIGTGLGLPWS